jgi:hypothetical protein
VVTSRLGQESIRESWKGIVRGVFGREDLGGRHGQLRASPFLLRSFCIHFSRISLEKNNVQHTYKIVVNLDEHPKGTEMKCFDGFSSI